MSLIATRAPPRVSSARNTLPMPPAPRTASMRNRPAIVAPMEVIGRSIARTAERRPHRARVAENPAEREVPLHPIPVRTEFRARALDDGVDGEAGDGGA